MLKQVTSLIIPKFIARKPKIKHGTYNKYGFVITLHQYCMQYAFGSNKHPTDEALWKVTSRRKLHRRGRYGELLLLCE